VGAADGVKGAGGDGALAHKRNLRIGVGPALKK
jgi:hypothetical protein